MTRDKTTNPGAPMSEEITRERYDRARQALMLATTDCDFHKAEFGWSPIYADAGKAVALVEELDRLRSAAGEVERMRKALEELLVAVEYGGLVELEKRRDQMAEWLQDNAPFVFSDQKHLDADTPERSYWHHGYMMALTDALALISQGEQ